MENNKFNRFYSTKSVHELLIQMRSHRITGSTLNREWYDALIKHLHEREITAEERMRLEHIMSADAETLRSEEALELNLKHTETPNQQVVIGMNKYPTLRNIAGFLMGMAWVVGVITIGISIVFLMDKGDGILTAIIVFVVGLITVLGLAATSEAIQVIIDIEHNTRKCAEKS